MSKMGSHDPFGHLKHKLRPKEGPGIKSPIWLSTIKSQESPWFPCVQVACNIPLQSSWQGLKLFFKPRLNQRFSCKVMGPQSRESPNCAISGLPFGSPKTKCHLDASPVANHIVSYNGEGGGFPQVRVVVSLVNSCLFVVRSCTKSAIVMH
jgi:hypothetical protein